MGIQQNLDNLITRTKEIEGREGSAKQYSELNEVLNNINNSGFRELSFLEEQHRLFKGKEVSVNLSSDDREVLTRLAADALDAFNEMPTAQSLKSGRTLQDLLKVLNKFVESYKLGLAEVFSEFVRLQYGGPGPTDLEISAGKTPSNANILSSFKHEYENFENTQKTRPFTAELLNQIERRGKVLKGLYEKVDFDVPDEVKEFFDGVERGGATLTSLNDTVLTYLIENKIDTQFKIIKNRTWNDH